MQAYYAARAPIYDAVYAKPERQADIGWLQAHLPTRLAGRRLLEVACGTGYWTPHLAATARHVTATDGVAEPLALARNRPGTQGVAFTQADAYALPPALGSFDGAFAGLWFSHVPIAQRPAFLHSLHARLTPGARVILIDNSRAQCTELPIADTDAAGNTWQVRTLPDGSHHRVLKNFPTEAELRALLAPQATVTAWRELTHFWLIEYELMPCSPTSL